ncbi:uncharacterized protein LOC131615714 isoform X2 [Vicia villosa]|uniref:uncharacterized protein LOC131615714 isoform X2 n=1 Tax=Vicia villosa TaxID=3911 RepID=UPI00273A9A7B|nr:uncharacterized protein LOC131615714 isoform X2 [Vicia villosa]
MNIEPKTEPGSPPWSIPTNPNNFENKSIEDLIGILRGTYQFEVFDIVEGVLLSRDSSLREEIRLLQENVDLERGKLLEDLDFERLSRIQAEVDFRQREEFYEKEKGRLRESYESLMREVKVNGLAEGVRVRELREKNGKLECEVKNLKEKCVEDGKEIEVLRVKNDGLEVEVLGLREMKGKWEEDSNEICVLRKMVGDLENEVRELRKLRKKSLDDSVAIDELKRKVRVMEDDKNELVKLEVKKDELEGSVKKNLGTISELRKENGKLADEKRRVEELLESSNTRFRGLSERVRKLENDIIPLLSVDASGDRKNEGGPSVKPVVADFEDKDRDVRDNKFRNDTGEEAEDAHHSPEVAVSTQPQSKGDKGAQGASPGKGTMQLEKNIEIINLVDDDDDDDDKCMSMSRGVHEKKVVFGNAMKIEDPTPSSTVAWQQQIKPANPLDMLKRKISFSDSESSSSTSSFDPSFLDNLAISSAVSHAKKRKV